MRDLPKVCRHLHLPVQSGSTRVLGLMRRRHTRDEYLELVASLRDAMPDIALSTDMIVGFPGETDADFEETLSLTAAVRYHSMFSFKYSPRPNTLAIKRLPDDVTDEEKTRRIVALQALQREIQGELYRQAIGREERVLVESRSRRRDWELSGRTSGNTVVNFAGDPDVDRAHRARCASPTRTRTACAPKRCRHRRWRQARLPQSRTGGVMQIEMTIKGLMVDPITNMPIIILRDKDGQRVLPIWVGVFEANAIALQMENVTTPRPMTHDLLKNVISDLKADIQKIVVSDLRENTFYALIYLVVNGEPVAIDARPSDAIALALRAQAPIFVEDRVIDNAKTVDFVPDKENSERLQKWLESLDPDTMGRYKM